jgi:SAM-dependent methyltransferase
MNVADYYDMNTRRFLKTGAGAGEEAIHRPVWAPGVENRSQAVHYVEDLVLARTRFSRTAGFMDLGCGVGGTMAYMHKKYPAEYRGITISGVQHELAMRKFEDTSRCRVVCGDMTDAGRLSEMRKELASPVAAICIESFLHVPDGLDFLGELGNVLRPGDSLFICDDFLSVELSGEQAHKVLEDFKSGWHALSLLAVSSVVHAAAGVGFDLETNIDLTGYLKPGRLTSKAIGVLVNLLRPLEPKTAWFHNFKGGDALQKALVAGLIEYRLIGFKKR